MFHYLWECLFKHPKYPNIVKLIIQINSFKFLTNKIFFQVQTDFHHGKQHDFIGFEENVILNQYLHLPQMTPLAVQ